MIGGGGMANVYLARDIILDRDVAVKVLRPDFSNNDEFKRRFEREAYSTTSLDHSNIVNIYDVGIEDEIYYMVMEYVNGKTLKEVIQDQGAVSVEKTVKIMKKLTSAIAHAHENQIVHRDIKPHNILMDQYGDVKVTDFGIAMAMSSTSITQTNSVLGSVHYISPEQARGGLANKKSDIYSLGVLMFELLTGRLPFSGESAVSIALKHLQSETPSPKRWNPSVPQSVENIVLKATAKDPFHRYDNAEEMLEDLWTALNPERLNEAPFKLPVDNEVTKAIPIITDDMKQNVQNGDTIVRSSQPEVKEKKGNKKWFTFTLTLAFILTIGIVATAFMLPNFINNEEVVVPDVTGFEMAEAIEVFQQAGLETTILTQEHESIPIGHVIKSDPAQGTSVKTGFEVALYESLGAKKEEFENYIGQQIEEAKRELKLKGFQDENIKAYPKESDRPENEIIAQLQPKPNELLSPKDYSEMTVFFEISKGPMVKVPALIGKSEDEVIAFVQENGLNLDNSKEPITSDEVEPGHVVIQNPESGTLLEKGETIEITLSKGTQPITHTVTKVIPFDSSLGEEQQRIDIYLDDLENNLDTIHKTVWITESTEISFDLVVPYKGTAAYKIYRNEQFIESDLILYSSLNE